MARCVVVTLLALVAGCEAAPEVEFVSTPLTPAETEAWSAAGVKSAHHEITVRRIMHTPSWCRTLDAEAVRTGSEVTLRVRARESDDPCPAGEGTFGYMAVIRDLPRGRYDLRVVHAYADPRRHPEVVLRHPVVVE